MKTILRKLQEKWDWWIYRRAYYSLRRMAIKNIGLSYLFELSIKEWNEKLRIPDSLKRATEIFHESQKKANHEKSLAKRKFIVTL